MRPHGCQYSYLPRVHNGSAKHSRVGGNIFAFMTHRISPLSCRSERFLKRERRRIVILKLCQDLRCLAAFGFVVATSLHGSRWNTPLVHAKMGMPSQKWPNLKDPHNDPGPNLRKLTCEKHPSETRSSHGEASQDGSCGICASPGKLLYCHPLARGSDSKS